MEKNAVIDLKKPYAMQEIKYPPEKKIQEVEDKYKDFPTDMTIKENYTFVKEGVKTVKKLIAATKAHGKMLKKDALEFGRNVDSAAKLISGRFKTINEPMAKVVTEHETKEEIKRREEERVERERLENVDCKIKRMQRLVPDNILSSSSVITEIINELVNNDVHLWADERINKVTKIKIAVLIQLQELFNMKEQAEKAIERVEEWKAEAERIEKEQKEQKIRDEEQKAIRIENARLHVENAKKEAELKAVKKAIAEAKTKRIKAEKEAEEAKRVEEIRKANARKAKLQAEKEAELKIIEDKKQAKKEAALKAAAKAETMNFVIGEWHFKYKITNKAGARLLNDIVGNEYKNIKWVN